MTNTPAASTPVPALVSSGPSVCCCCGRPVEMNETINLRFRRTGEVRITCAPCVLERAKKGAR